MKANKNKIKKGVAKIHALSKKEHKSIYEIAPTYNTSSMNGVSVTKELKSKTHFDKVYEKGIAKHISTPNWLDIPRLGLGMYKSREQFAQIAKGDKENETENSNLLSKDVVLGSKNRGKVVDHFLKEITCPKGEKGVDKAIEEVEVIAQKMRMILGADFSIISAVINKGTADPKKAQETLAHCIEHKINSISETYETFID